MKRKSIRLLFVTIIIVLSSSMLVMGSQKSNMEQFLKYCKEGNFKVAKKYEKKLPKYANEKCVKKMSKKMKNAYNEKLKSIASKVGRYYYTDIDNDNKVELLVVKAYDNVLSRMCVYKYKNHKVKYITSCDSMNSDYHVYPGYNGIVRNCNHNSFQIITLLTMKKNKLKKEVILDTYIEDKYIKIPLQLKEQKKGPYMIRFYRLLDDCEKEYNSAYTQYDINMAANYEYKLWNKEFNKVYKKELSLLGKKKKDKLKESTENWLAKIDEKAQKQALDFEGGSAYSSVYVGAKSSILKKRIKWMIKNYKDVGCKM